MRLRGCSLKKQKNLAQCLYRLYLSLSQLGSLDLIQYLLCVHRNKQFTNTFTVIEMFFILVMSTYYCL